MEDYELTTSQLNPIIELMDLLICYFDLEDILKNIPVSMINSPVNLDLSILIMKRSTVSAKIFAILCNHYPFKTSEYADNIDVMSDLAKKFCLLVNNLDGEYYYRPNLNLIGEHTNTFFNLINKIKVEFDLIVPKDRDNLFIDRSELNKDENELYQFLIAAIELMQVQSILNNATETKKDNDPLLLYKNVTLRDLNKLNWQQTSYKRPSDELVGSFRSILERLRTVLVYNYNLNQSINHKNSTKKYSNYPEKIKQVRSILSKPANPGPSARAEPKITIIILPSNVIIENDNSQSDDMESSQLEIMNNLYVKIKEITETTNDEERSGQKRKTSKLFEFAEAVIIVE